MWYPVNKVYKWQNLRLIRLWLLSFTGQCQVLLLVINIPERFKHEIRNNKRLESETVLIESWATATYDTRDICNAYRFSSRLGSVLTLFLLWKSGGLTCWDWPWLTTTRECFLNVVKRQQLCGNSCISNYGCQVNAVATTAAAAAAAWLENARSVSSHFQIQLWLSNYSWTRGPSCCVEESEQDCRGDARC